MPSGQTIREELVRYGLIELLGTATSVAGAAAAFLVDTTRLQSNSLSASAFDDCYVRISGGDGTGDTDGEQVKVDYLDTTLGRLYVTPSFSGTDDSATTYEIWKEGIDPDDVDRARDEALTRLCSVWSMHPVSIVPNAGYVDAVGASNWTAIGGATIAIQTLSFPYEFATNTILGTNAAGNEGATSPSIYVQPNQFFYIYVPVSVRTGTAELVVRDVTNGADISLGGTATATLRGWTGIEGTFTIPAACGEINVQLRGQESNAVVEWGPVYFHGQDMKMIQVPARVLSRQHVGPVYFMSNIPIVGGQIHWGEETLEERMGIRRQQVGDAVRLLFEDLIGQFPHSYLERDFYAALSTNYQTVAQRIVGDAATTLCPTDYVAPAMVRILAEQYMVKQPGQADFWQSVLQHALSDLASAERDYGPLPFPVQERARVIGIPIFEI
ncbi:hypothetical protein LCGC14_0310730 [marine sediment metagenome]|uniref:Uncharacterized protein n=1 Tax=marine sediment metagenome TaxID=412755 RepID=A0A0F9TMB1_9ZZZZ